MYIMACDERGSIYRFSKSQSWVYGGLIFKKKHRKALIRVWNSIKTELCGDPDIELKWSHFFTNNPDNPLLNLNNRENQISWALETVFEKKHIITPISTRVPKDRASDICYKVSPKGKQVLDYEVLSVPVYGQFCRFLKIVNGFGEMWFDQLGSIQEQERKQTDWLNLRDNNSNLEYRRMMRKIKPQIKFFDSKEEPVIQIADFVSGVIWAASEGEEAHLLKYFQAYFPAWWSKINLVTTA